MMMMDFPWSKKAEDSLNLIKPKHSREYVRRPNIKQEIIDFLNDVNSKPMFIQEMSRALNYDGSLLGQRLNEMVGSKSIRRFSAKGGRKIYVPVVSKIAPRKSAYKGRDENIERLELVYNYIKDMDTIHFSYGEAARATHIPKGSLHFYINKLVDKGFLQKKLNNDDTYTYLIVADEESEKQSEKENVLLDLIEQPVQEQDYASSKIEHSSAYEESEKQSEDESIDSLAMRFMKECNSTDLLQFLKWADNQN